MTRLVAAIAAGVLLVGAPLGASLTVPAGFREIVSDAALIVRGRITDVRAVAIRGRDVESIGTIAVESVLKGEAAGFVSVRVPGGTIGRSRFVMVGAPTLRTGQHSVFFLDRDPEGAWRPVGLTLGIYRVQPEPTTGRPVILPPVVAGRTAPAAGPVVRGDPRRKPMAVSEFESLVRLVMAAPAPPRAVPRRGGR